MCKLLNFGKHFRIKRTNDEVGIFKCTALNQFAHFPRAVFGIDHFQVYLVTHRIERIHRHEKTLIELKRQLRFIINLLLLLQQDFLTQRVIQTEVKWQHKHDITFGADNFFS